MSVEAERGEALKVTAAKQREAAVTWELAVFPEVSSGVVLFPVLKEILGFGVPWSDEVLFSR